MVFWHYEIENVFQNDSFEVLLHFSSLKRSVDLCRSRLVPTQSHPELEEQIGRKLKRGLIFRLRQDPADLEALGQAIKLHEKLQGERDTIEGMIAPIQEQFAILDKNEVTIPDEVGTIERQLMKFVL